MRGIGAWIGRLVAGCSLWAAVLLMVILALALAAAWAWLSPLLHGS